MKKFLALLMVLCLMLPCVAALAEDTYEIALITDVGNIDDHSFNQGCWEGVVKYAEEKGITYAYYRPSEDSNEARVESMKAAIEKGAKVLVLPGFLFETAATEMQSAYPEVTFVVVDTNPQNPQPNTYSIYYQEEQAGFFAGYAIVKEGYKKLGFLGGIDVPAVIRYGFGFVQGAEYAAKEMGIDDVEIKYWYSGSFSPTDDIKNKMDSWYADGTEVVFSCGGGIYLSAVAAAEAADALVIGVDTDQSYDSDLIITSAYKDLTGSVVYALSNIYEKGEGKLPEDMAGKVETLGADAGAVGIPTNEHAWRFDTFTVDEYEAVLAKVVAGEVEVSAAIDAQPAVENVNVDYQN